MLRFLALAFAFSVCVSTAVSFAQDAGAQPAAPGVAQVGGPLAPTEAAEKPKETLEEIFIIPEGKKPEELLVFLEETQRRAVKATLTPQSTEEEFNAFKSKFAAFMVQVADKIIAATPADELLEQGHQIKMIGLSALAQDDPEKVKDLVAYIDSLKSLGKYPELAAQGKAMLIVNKILPLQKMKPEEIPLDRLTEIQNEVKALLTETPSQAIAGLALELIEFIAEVGNEQGKPEFGAAVREDFTKFFLESKEPGLQMIGKALEAQGRRALGKTVELAGITVDGKEFDWKAYRGKYVLVVFWASWCQPCKTFEPYILKAYETYKDKGFDVVGIGYNDETEALKKHMESTKMPWTVISDEATVEKKMPSLGDTFGIEGVPTIFLVDKEAKVVLDNAFRADFLEQIEKFVVGEKGEQEAGSGGQEEK